MLEPIPVIEAFKQDAVSSAALELDNDLAALWLESAVRLERAANVRRVERDRLLAAFLAAHGVITFPAAPVSQPAVMEAATSLASAMEDASL